MFLEERQELIVRMVEHDGKVKVKDLSAQFKVTEDCIRKDLGSLERQGRLKRTYGGAVKLTQSVHMIEVSRHRHMDVDAKRRIAQAAVSLIQEKDMVFLDISTSNLAIAELLMKSDRDLTIVTNMIDVLGVLARNPRIDLIFAGGQINRGRDGFLGSMTQEFIAKLKPDIAFVGAVGVDVAANSVSTYDIEDGMSKATIIGRSKRTYVVAESRKLSTNGNYDYAKLSALAGLITDSEPPSAVRAAAAELGVEIILP